MSTEDTGPRFIVQSEFSDGRPCYWLSKRQEWVDVCSRATVYKLRGAADHAVRHLGEGVVITLPMKRPIVDAQARIAELESENARLRTALAHYTHTTVVSDWGNQECEYVGGPAREALGMAAPDEHELAAIQGTGCRCDECMRWAREAGIVL
jgi:hypothetical protein